DWKQINDPKLKIGFFEGQDEGQMYSLKNSPMMVKRYIEYFRCTRKRRGTIHSDSDKVDVYAENIEIGGKKYTKIEIEFLGKNNQEFKNSFSPKDYQNDSKEIDNSFTNKTIVTLGKTIRFTLYPKNNFDLIGYLYSNDKSHTEAIKRDFVNFVNKKTEKEVVEYVNTIDVCTLSELDFEPIKEALIVLTKNAIDKDKSEAILRLISSISEKDYSDFFALLEANNNQIIKKLINDLNDAIVVGNNYYSQFVNTLVQMFVSNPNTWLWKLPKDENAVAEYFTNHYLRRTEVKITNIEELINGNSQIIWQSFYYDKETGNITIQQNVSKIQALGGINGKVAYAPAGAPQLLNNTQVSPLSPVLFDYSQGEIQPIKILLDNAGYSTGDLGIVPALFLQFGYDKIKAKTIEKTTLLALNGLTIYAQLPAVIQGATMTKRLWAAAEVAAAVGDIVVNTANVSPEIKQVVDTYNLTMGAIGLKNLGKGVVNFSKGLSNDILVALKENKGLRNFLTNKYLEYRIAITKLKNTDEWGKLSPNVRKEIVQQEKTFIELADARNIPNDNWGIKGVFINGKTSEDILSIPKGQRPAPETYLSASYIREHLAKFEKEGGAFIIRLRDLDNPKYISIAPRKFIGLKSDMDAILSKYKNSGNNLNVLIKELDLGDDYFKSGDEVFYVVVKSDKGFKFNIPDGNEGGAYEGLWIPGGYTKHGTREAVISNSANYFHNNNIEEFIAIFGKDNVTKIKQ
ncbi:MAG: hypothetical protein Q4D72_08715, partial [Capnocytophaga sp.]|nr:hypothetical protein [Capnocytophaga sp.]